MNCDGYLGKKKRSLAIIPVHVHAKQDINLGSGLSIDQRRRTEMNNNIWLEGRSSLKVLYELLSMNFCTFGMEQSKATIFFTATL